MSGATLESVPLVRDGEGATVALIDSGVDRSHPSLRAARLEHVRVVRGGAGVGIEPAPEGGDASGHGTACAGIVHRMVPSARLVDVRALGEDGRCSKNALLAAVRYCIERRFDVVNLSLGIDVPRRAALRAGDTLPVLALYELADAAVNAGVVLVAAGPNIPEVRTYPGKFKSLIGVGRASFADEERLESSRCEDHELLAPGTDVVAPSLDGGERRWTGTSFATPFVSAHVARIVAASPRLPLERVKDRLHTVAAATSLR